MSTKAKTIDMVWVERPSNSGHRPPSWRLSGDMSLVIVVAPVTTPADPNWKDKSYSLEASSSTEAFNRLVGWKVCAWHWSVVQSGDLVGSGDVDSLEGAKIAAIAAVPPRRSKLHNYL